ncbi:uncharacterized protein BDV14DRAFT_141914 [Aspergillus stella-maris]|uniref:uncharacterized protein n=1 Tax=Aspergillus stella-maris TaxID=1810926 RepID=UPI003CCE4994
MRRQSTFISRLRSYLRFDRPFKTSDSRAVDAQSEAEPSDTDFPTFPPPPPEQILQDASSYWESVSARKYACPRGVFEDNSLYALYRLYECFVLDRVFGYRNYLEWFWRQPQWSISEIPDPKDEAEPSRYAFLACVTYLMVRSFNARVKLGLTRSAPAIMSSEEIEEARNRKDGDRPYEEAPRWAAAVAPLVETLYIPNHDGVLLDGKDDERADPDFLARNIVIWTPHIHFT